MAYIDKIRLTISWLKQAAIWLSRTRMLALAIIPIVMSGAYLLGEHPTEPHIRRTGLALQLAGVLSVAFGVASTRKQFGHPPIIARVGAFFDTRPRFPRPITGDITVNLQGVSATGSAGNLTAGVAREPTTDERLRALEQRVNELATKTASEADEIRTELRKHGELLDAESASRSEADTLLHRKLEMAATGGLDLSLCGVLWLLVGSAFGTIPLELSHLF